MCHEVSDADETDRQRQPLRRPENTPYDSWSNRPQQSPNNLHEILKKIWSKTTSGSGNLEVSSSAPNLNATWQSTPQASQAAVSNVWRQADSASKQKSNRMGSIFNRMRQPTGSVIQPPPPMNSPTGFDPRNSAVANVWNNAANASRPSSPPPLINGPWNRMPQSAPMGAPVPRLNRGPAPASFSALLAEAHRRRMPYARAAQRY